VAKKDCAGDVQLAKELSHVSCARLPAVCADVTGRDTRHVLLWLSDEKRIVNVEKCLTVWPKPIMSGTSTRNPISCNAGIIKRHESVHSCKEYYLSIETKCLPAEKDRTYTRDLGIHGSM
jgi:hypothetical protein